MTVGSDNRGTGTITNDDSGVTASINDVTVTEGNVPDTVDATFTVALSGPAPAAGPITCRTADGSAASPADYTACRIRSLPIAQNATSARSRSWSRVTRLPEGTGRHWPRSSSSTWSAATGPVTITADSRGTGTIVDDDNPVSASINDVAVTEGNAPNTVDATFTVTLSGPAPAAIHDHLPDGDGSAASPRGLHRRGERAANIGQGATSAQITIVVKGDGLPEGTGTPLADNFFVDLVGSTGPMTISADSRGTGTITMTTTP